MRRALRALRGGSAVVTGTEARATAAGHVTTRLLERRADDGGEDVVVFVVPAAATEPAGDEVREWIAARVPRHMRPSLLVVTPDLPRGATSLRVTTHELRRRAAEAARAPDLPRDPGSARITGRPATRLENRWSRSCSTPTHGEPCPASRT